MIDKSVLQWEDGSGWLVFSGGPSELSEVRAAALGRIQADGGIAYIGVDEDSAEDLIEDIGELGGPTGYLVNVLAEDDDTIKSQLEDSAMIVIPAEIDIERMKSVLSGAALDGIKNAFQRGAVLLVEGELIGMFGAVFVVENQGIPGFDWLKGAFIVPQITSIDDSPVAREILNAGAATLAVGVGVGSALALGPSGEVEAWGQGHITLTLGRDMMQE